MSTIVDRAMTAAELLESINHELAGYLNGHWQPGRLAITRSRWRLYCQKVADETRLAIISVL